MRKFKLVTYSLFLILFSLSIVAPFYGYAAEPEDFSIDITTTEDEPFGMATLAIDGSILTTLQVESTVPSIIGAQNYRGMTDIVEQSVPDTEDAELFYPVNMRLKQDWNYDTLNEYFTHYVYVDNNSMDYGNETFSLTSTTVQYPLKAGESVEIYVSDIVSEVDLDVSSKGIYQIWLNEITLTEDITILSPTNKKINYRLDELPPIAAGSSISMGQYFFFAAYETGVYKIFIETSDPIIRVEAEYRKPTKIRLGEFLSAGADRQSTEFFDPTYTMDVYSLEIDDLANYYKYIINLDYGSPIIRAFYDAPYSSNLYTMASGFNNILPAMNTETIYIVVDNPDYMYWPYAGISASRPLKYQMKFEEIEPAAHDVGTNETLAITKEEGVKSRSIVVESTSLLSLHCENIGSNSPDVYSNSILSSYLVKVSDDNIRSPQLQDVLYSGAQGEFITYLVEPGTYVVGFQHSGSLGTEFLNFTSAFRPLHDYSTVDWDKSSSDNFISLSGFQDVTLEPWANYPDNTGASYGTGVKFLIDESFWNYGFNITIDPSKNAEIFTESINPNLGFLWDDSNNEYTDYTTEIQPGNGQVVPFKTNGTTNGDAFYIGAYDKFSAVTLDIQSPPTDMDEFRWEYLSDEDTWRTLDPVSHDFVDGTNAGTGSLNRSGTISWNPETLNQWNHYSSTFNDTSPEIPDTYDRNLYLIRCLTTDPDALVPNITSATLTKFIEIEFDLKTQLAFDVGGSEDPVFYEIDTRNWNVGVINNADTPKSILDSDNDIPYNFVNRTAILFLSGDDLVIRDYNGSNNGVNLKFDGNLTFSVAVYNPINNLFIRNYSIGANVPSVHSSERNLTDLPGDYTFSLGLDVVSDIYLEISSRTVFDWTQINVQIVNGTVFSSYLVFPTQYDEYTASYFAGTLDGGELSLGYTGSDINFTHEFGCLSDLVYLRLQVQNTTDGPVFFKVYGGQFGYPQLLLSLKPGEGFPGWATWTIIGGSAGVIAVTAGILIYRKKHFLKIP